MMQRVFWEEDLKLSIRINFIPALENGYRVNKINSKGFIVNTVDITQNELPILVKELVGDDNVLLEALRSSYSLFEAKSFEFIEN